jgi:hypothetical protein
MSSSGAPFSPLGAAVTIAATTASQSAVLPGIGGDSILVYNGSNAPAHFKMGISANGAVTATITDKFVAPGTSQTFSIPISSKDITFDTVAVILETGGAGNIEFQRGSGE